jgi:hypothetical protein
LLTRQLMQSMHSIPLLDVRCFSFKWDLTRRPRREN